MKKFFEICARGGSLIFLLALAWRGAVCPVDAAMRNSATIQNGGFSVRVWQTEDGLPQNSINAITQTRDGYIWIGTYGGLARFDGDRFQIFDAASTPELHDSRVVSLSEDSTGALWIGHDSGNITHYYNGAFYNVSDIKGINAEQVVAVREESPNRTWVLRLKGTLELFGSPVRLSPKRNLTLAGLTDLTRGPSGMWMRADGEVFKISDQKLVPVDFGYAHYTGYVQGICASADGGLWVIRDLSVRKWLNGNWVADLGTCPWEQSSISAMLELHDGSLAVGTMERGLFIFRKNGQILHFDQNNGLPQNWVRCLYEDREDDLWLGAGTAGMVVIRETPFSTLDAPDKWEGRTVLSVAPGGEGGLWIGTEGSGLYSYKQGQWMHYGEVDGVRNKFIWSVAECGDGGVWAGTWGGGVYHSQNNIFHRVDALAVGDAPVLALKYTPQDQRLWVGTRQGLLYLKDNQPTWVFRGSAEDPRGVCALARDADGVMWCAMVDGGLGRYFNQTLSQFRRADGLSSDSVQCLLADADGVLWIGTADGGLNRLKAGKFATIGLEQGLPSNAICHLADDGLGHIWMSTHHGIVRVSKTELNRCADGIITSVVSQIYDQEDGLPTIEFSGGMEAAGCQTRDGRIWFASSRGLVSVDPVHVHANGMPPPVVIESVRVDGKGISGGIRARGDIALSPRNQRLEFKYTALSFVAPSRVFFKYKLEGLDNDWVDAGSKRSAYYSHLAAGTYLFKVIACNSDGIWSPVGASLPFVVSAFVWEKTWFITLATIAILLLVAYVARAETRRRMRRHLEQVEHERSIDRERSRIAQDIHDDIGASLTRITMLSQSATASAGGAWVPSAALVDIHSTARELTRSLDEIVWAVDPTHDTLDSLVCYMAKFAQDFLSAAGVRCRLDLPMQLPPWPLVPQTRHHLFLAFKETLNNAVKHSAATEVKIGLILKENAFVVTVKDNGRGFSPLADPSSSLDRIVSGHGIANLQRRLASIGGSCEIAAPDGQGASISFIVGMPTPPDGAGLARPKI